MVLREDAFRELITVIDKLLGDDGCPWDREQTVQSLSHMLLEEVCEAIDAIRDPHAEHLADELGDVFVASLFIAKAAQKEGRFDWSKPFVRAREKLIRRHPHIFEKEVSLTPEEITVQWEELKKKEAAHKHRKGPFDGISASLPSLAMMQKLLHIAKKHPSLSQTIENGFENGQEGKDMEEEICAKITQLVLQAEKKGIQVEQALRKYYASCKQTLEKDGA